MGYHVHISSCKTHSSLSGDKQQTVNILCTIHHQMFYYSVLLTTVKRHDNTLQFDYAFQVVH